MTALAGGSVGADRPVEAGRAVNPFLLPAATASRFILLITITLSAAGSSFDLVAGGSSSWRTAYARCDGAADAAAARAHADALVQGYLSCLNELGVRRAMAGFGAMALTALVIAAVHVLRPRITIRRQHLVPADPRTHADLYETVRRLAGREGLRRVPRILLDTNRRAPGGRAFGHYPRYYLRLNIGTLHRGRERGGEGVVEAVVLHELAHLRNRDVDLTGLTQAAVWVFAGLVGVPVVVYTALRTPANLLDVGTRTLAASVLVAVLAAAVLRSREHYADVRAAVAGGRLPDLGSPPLPWLRALLPLHPHDDRRMRVVRDPGLLMRWVPGEALGAGIAAALGTTHLGVVLRLLLPASDRPAFVVSSLVYAIPAMAIVLAGAYRSTLLALAAGRRAPRGTAAGAGLATGIVLGLIASPARNTGSWMAEMGDSPVIAAVMALVLLSLCLILCRWLTTVATAWLPAARGRTLLPSYLGALAPAALLLGVGMHAWSEAAMVALHAGNIALGVYVLFAAPFDAALLTVLLVAALYPLASWFRQQWPGRGREVHLDAPSPVMLPPVRVRPLLALAPAALFLVLGVAGEILTPDGILITLLHALGVRPAGDPLNVLLAQTATLVLIFVVLQLLAGTAVAAIADGGRAGLGPSHAVLAAVTTGAVATALLFGRPLTAFCLYDPAWCDVRMLRDGIGNLLLAILAVGLLVTLAGAGLVGGIRALADLTRKRSGSRRHDVRPGSLWVRGPLALVTTVAIAAWFAVMAPVWAVTWGYASPARPPSRQASSASAVPPPGPPGSGTARDACAQAHLAGMTPPLGDNFHVAWATAFARLAESDRPFLVTIGRADYALARDARFTFRNSMAAVDLYCGSAVR
ncbi:hypothetical protein [Sphaerisporangium dianthi]|uniref:Peptidase M48 domain-containing protein n=1 Tax=Sphaerisporangium dianthi TaxID=1436120 RepID=A0ABV9CM36_9ACTN